MDLSNTPVLYRVKKKRKIINAIIAIAVIRFFLFVLLSGVIIQSYLSKKEEKSKTNIVLKIQIWLLQTLV